MTNMKKLCLVLAVAAIGWYSWNYFMDGKYDSNAKYIGNRNNLVFHRVTCRNVKKMKESNKFYAVDREKLVKKGMRPAKCCRP